MPLGLIQPIHQASRTIRNSVTDKATRKAKARAMALGSRAAVGLSADEAPSVGLRNMKKPAPAKAPRMATRKTTMTGFMRTDSGTRAAGCGNRRCLRRSAA